MRTVCVCTEQGRSVWRTGGSSADGQHARTLTAVGKASDLGPVNITDNSETHQQTVFEGESNSGVIG